MKRLAPIFSLAIFTAAPATVRADAAADSEYFNLPLPGLSACDQCVSDFIEFQGIDWTGVAFLFEPGIAARWLFEPYARACCSACAASPESLIIIEDLSGFRCSILVGDT